MRKLGAVLMGVVLLGVLAGSAYAGTGVGIGRKTLKWSTSTTGGPTYSDSTYLDLSVCTACNGTAGLDFKYDTTNVFSTGDWAIGSVIPDAPNTAFGPGVFAYVISNATIANVDSISVAWDSSPDGIHWVAGPFVVGTFTTGNTAVQVPLSWDFDSVAPATTPAIGAFYRIRCKSDGHASSAYKQAQVQIVYPRNLSVDQQ